MSQEITTAVPNGQVTQGDWLKGALNKNPSRSRGINGQGSAAALATQWKSSLRPARVPLLPPPNFGPVQAAQPVAFAAASNTAPTVDAVTPPVRQTATIGGAVAGPTTSRSAVQSAGFHNVLVMVLSLILVLLVLYLIAGPFGDSVPLLRPFHQTLAGLLSHRSQ